ncbi:MAG TPA: hypothetical protein VOA00_12660, partial [Thermoanaerobaculia bacterium]|nr:hypothetical protein [Thermoanaerobaculia bacterium]
MKSHKLFALALGWLIAGCALGQHEHHSAPPAPSPTPKPAVSPPGAPTPTGTPAPADSMKTMEMD